MMMVMITMIMMIMMMIIISNFSGDPGRGIAKGCASTLVFQVSDQKLHFLGGLI